MGVVAGLAPTFFCSKQTPYYLHATQYASHFTLLRLFRLHHNEWALRDSNPRILVKSQGQSNFAKRPISNRWDLNSRPLVSKTNALPGCATAS
jgi:hypothetical protein